ncbi:MAG: SwmB domain-containing protein, partial [Rhodoferax sp.]|nr:SwmB domain-containing protein [Rhodoferax sp.]
DAAGNAAEQEVSLQVSNIPEAPTISGIPATKSITQNISSGMNFTVADQDSPTLFVTLTPSNGTIGGLPAVPQNDLSINLQADNTVQLTGPTALINQALADATFTSSVIGAASVRVRVSEISFTDNAAATSNTATYNFNTIVPVAAGSLQWLLGKGINGTANLAEATASTGAVVFLSKELDTMVKVTFSDSESHSVIKTVRSTGKIQAVTLDASDFGPGANQLAGGLINVTATASDAAGNTIDGYAASPSEVDTNTRTFTLDASAPTINTATVVGNILILKLDDPLGQLATDAAHKPKNTDFTVTVNGNSNAVTRIRILGSSLELTLNERVAPDANVRLSYTASATAANYDSGPVADQAGNALANFSDMGVNVSTPTSAGHPVITSIVLTDNSSGLKAFYG